MTAPEFEYDYDHLTHHIWLSDHKTRSDLIFHLDFHLLDHPMCGPGMRLVSLTCGTQEQMQNWQRLSAESLLCDSPCDLYDGCCPRLTDEQVVSLFQLAKSSPRNYLSPTQMMCCIHMFRPLSKALRVRLETLVKQPGAFTVRPPNGPWPCSTRNLRQVVTAQLIAALSPPLFADLIHTIVDLVVPSNAYLETTLDDLYPFPQESTDDNTECSPKNGHQHENQEKGDQSEGSLWSPCDSARLTLAECPIFGKLVTWLNHSFVLSQSSSAVPSLPTQHGKKRRHAEQDLLEKVELDPDLKLAKELVKNFQTHHKLTQHLVAYFRRQLDAAMVRAKSTASSIRDSKTNDKTLARTDVAIRPTPFNVMQLADTYNELVDLVALEFGNRPVFRNALSTTLTQVLRLDNCVQLFSLTVKQVMYDPPARWSSDFQRHMAFDLHTLLRSHTDAQLTVDEYSKINGIVSLYHHLPDADVFEYNTGDYLARRLHKQHDLQSRSLELEQQLVDKLGQHPSIDRSSWTKRWARMVQDVVDSQRLTREFQVFQENLTTDAQTQPVLDVTVCGTGFWPHFAAVPQLKLAESLRKWCDRYQEWYIKLQPAHLRRKLAWRFDLGQAEIEICFQSNQVQRFVVSTYQMILLTLFNQRKVWTWQEILIYLGLATPLAASSSSSATTTSAATPTRTSTELAVHVLSLVHPRIGIVQKQPATPQVDAHHRFRLSLSYKVSSRVQTVPLSLLDSKTPVQPPTGRALWLRHAVDKAILAVAKRHHCRHLPMSHRDLVESVFKIIIELTVPESFCKTIACDGSTCWLSNRAKPKPADIRKRILAAIERNELARDAQNPLLYHYVP